MSWNELTLIASSIIQEMEKEIERIEKNIKPDTADNMMKKISLDISFFPPSLSVTTGIDTLKNLLMRNKKKHLVFLREVFNGSWDPRFLDREYSRKVLPELYDS